MKIAEYRAAQAAQMDETTFQDAVTDLAQDLGWLTFHDYDSRRNPSGFPDLVMVRRGRLIFAELKTQKGRVRPEQYRWQAELLAVAEATSAVAMPPRVQVFLWRPLDLIEGRIVDVLR